MQKPDHITTESSSTFSGTDPRILDVIVENERSGTSSPLERIRIMYRENPDFVDNLFNRIAAGEVPSDPRVAYLLGAATVVATELYSSHHELEDMYKTNPIIPQQARP